MTVVEPEKLRRIFDWRMVDERLLRRLLIVRYGEDPDGQLRDLQLSELRQMSRAGLEANAERVFGRGLSVDDLTPATTRVLFDRWLRTLPPAEVKRLALTLIRKNRPTTKGEILDRLEGRTLDKTFKANLASAFNKAHKSRQAVASGGTVAGHRAGALIRLTGEAAQPRTSREHQVDAQAALTDALTSGQRHALIVMPTGAGKTFTAVRWLLERLESEDDARVLWITHRTELADQAGGAFVADSRSRSTAFGRNLRVIHGGASAGTVLAKADNDVVVTTYQSIKAAPLRKFLRRPTFVVIDEAHHAGADRLNDLLRAISDSDGVRMVMGLTATPYPTGVVAKWRFQQLFGEALYRADVRELTDSGVLARPLVASLDTGQRIELDPAIRQRTYDLGDLLPSTLAELDNESRNQLIADTCAKHAEAFGPTLVFAVNIDHAERLTGCLVEAGLPAKSVHSRSLESVGEVLGWYRSEKAPVLVSVGMLNEGVDLPHAKTAVIARPTASRILMQQMVGRVLRGPQNGGTPSANVVLLRDRFVNFSDLLDPAEVLYGPHAFELGAEESEIERLPDLVDEDGNVIPLGVAAQVGRILDAPEMSLEVHNDDLASDRRVDPLLTLTPLVGYYELHGFLIPVFEHQVAGFDSLLTAALGTEKLPAVQRFFDDGPPPFPSIRSLRELVGHVRAFGEGPPWHPLRADRGCAEVARQIVDGDLGPKARAAFLRERWSTHLDREMTSLERFAEEVDLAVRDLLRDRPAFDGERMPRAGDSEIKLPLDRERDLRPRFAAVQRFAEDKLPAHLRAWLVDGIDVAWSKRPSKSHLGYWTMSTTGKNKGQRRIRVNCIYRTKSSIVSDEMLEYLLWHELLHDVLPGRGHDAEFRELEALFENAAELDAEWDTLGERYDLDPRRYSSHAM